MCLLVIYIIFKNYISFHNKRQITANELEKDNDNSSEKFTNPLIYDN